ncbi:hypothetical protein F7725_001410 [Dissostichus mawsoni]|uniref:PiggyBac transposable element-derived protein domain-containing protein n=1 Tax=Dissostichus mawsoni TaxID=36200 RepID=A0A7J5ZH93_DISMA|nr:hypothetical protein F7725_001410 [Dissostichus mawsoni]
MGGVDVSDALSRVLQRSPQTMKWYKTFFYPFLDIVVVNSFLLHKELYKMKSDPSRTKPQKTFREQLAAEMLEYAEGSAPPHHHHSHAGPSHGLQQSHGGGALPVEALTHVVSVGFGPVLVQNLSGSLARGR